MNMNTRILSFIALTLVLILNACSPLKIVRSSDEQPAPVEEVDSPSSGYQPVTVDHVEVTVGVGSPIPVQVIVSGSLPDTCAQIDYAEVKQHESSFLITLSTVPSNSEDCTLARDALPFRIMIPLNIVELRAGSYTVDVNGSHADFLVETANTISSLPGADSAITTEDIQVDSVNVEIGVGSPIPVHAVVGLSLPNTCAQLGEIRLHRDGNTYYVRLITDTAERAGCKADLIPFRLEIPLNIVNLPEGPYEVNVNGVTASFDLNARPAGDSDGSASAIEPACSAAVDVSEADGQIRYNGISFDLDPVIAGSVSARICPVYLPQEEQMVNETHPPYTEFFFPAFSRQNVDFQPEIRIL
jgi:hypothetical protein